MKRILLVALALLAIYPSCMSADKNKKKTAETASAANDSSEIHWLTLDQVQEAMKKEPRKVYMDVYTDWCGWCKVMEKKTFTNKNVIKYMNQKYYAVRLNAEQKDSIRFLGKMYGFVPEKRANQLALDILHEQMSYPTSVIFEENFMQPQPIPGYLEVANMEMILKYEGENIYKTVPFPQYQQEFKASW
ncbi:thioredoxin family protein [Chitinophagaceae bacterium MMS25-I14]